MLDIKFIRENAEVVKKAVADKQLANEVNVDELLELDKKYLVILQKVETHRSLKNALSKNISKVDKEEKAKLLLEATDIKKELDTFEASLQEIQTQLNDLLLKLPNLASEDTPIGVDDSENIVIRKWGEPRKFDFRVQDDLEIGERLDLIDIKKAVEVSGARFNYLKNDAVLLQFALVQFAFQTLTNSKTLAEIAQKVGNPDLNVFTPVVPPVIMKADVMKRMDRLDPITERYYLPSDEFVLVGSAEHTMGPLLMDETVSVKDLPIRFVGYSTAFRREAGSYGKDMRGILRVHQFDKLEMETFTTQEKGMVEQDLMVGIQEYFMQQLQIPYQVVICCTGDMGKPDYRHIDIECWVPSQNKYRETHSSDYMTDFQARRLNAKYDDKGTKKFLYMNDATVFAIGRTLIAILENYQQADGSVKIPEVLQKYMGGQTEIANKRFPKVG